MRSSIISLSLAAIIGVVIGLLLQSPKPIPNSPDQSVVNAAAHTITTAKTTTTSPPAATTSSTTPPNMATLSQQLQQEIAARKALQKQVTALSEQLTLLAPNQKKHASSTPQTSAIPDELALAGSPQASTTAGNAWFNAQALIEAGMEAAEAERLKAQFEQLELDKLYLRDRAVREGWPGGSRYREELQQLEAQTGNLQQELGEDSYDAYLFASGQPNRVAVQSVLASSAAGVAGIQSGDHILRYGNQRIYNWRNLQEATTQGDVNETVIIEVLRDNKSLQFYVSRGPLGIRMTSMSVAP